MKPSIHARIHKKMSKHDKLYGIVTLGERGQVVIPAEARRDLHLRPGDQLVAIGKFGKALGLIKVEELQELIKVIMANFAGGDAEAEIKSHVGKIFGKLFKS